MQEGGALALRRARGCSRVRSLCSLVAVVSTVKEREAERQRQIAVLERSQADAEGARAALLAARPLEARSRFDAR